MSLLPDIVNGAIVEKKEPQLYTPPQVKNVIREEERQHELNNLGRRTVTKDFSDSPHLNV